MNSGFSEDGKMDVEESNVEGRRHDGDDGRLHNQLGHEGQRANGLVGQPTPQVTEQEGGAEAACVERQIFDTVKIISIIFIISKSKILLCVQSL